jgi:hypothetical protein
MKVSNGQTPSDAQDGVSRDTLNKWQREDSAERSEKHAPHKTGDPKEAGKQAEG